MRVELDGYHGVASPIKLSRTPATYRSPPPALNQHALEVFGEGGSADPGGDVNRAGLARR
jgi:formyl-CoA transferase